MRGKVGHLVKDKKSMIKGKKIGILKGTQLGIRPRHIEAIKNIGKYRTEAEGLEKLNYSKSYVKSGLIKRTKSWEIVSEEMLPNNLLARVNLGLLKHKEWQARSSGLDKAYRAKHIYTKETHIEINPVTEPIEVTRRRNLELAVAITGELGRIYGNK